jgi:hypothetical protein
MQTWSGDAPPHVVLIEWPAGAVSEYQFLGIVLLPFNGQFHLSALVNSLQLLA